MAAWISGGVINANSHNHLISLPSFFTVSRPASRIRFLRNSSTGDASTETDSVAPVELLVPPSLISALNVEKALRGIAITDEDHYGRLGLERGCSSEEVMLAYKNKVLDVMNMLADEEQQVIGKQLDLLKESYRILSTGEERRLYDWSLGRNDNPDRYIWPFEVDKTPLLSTENPPPQHPEDVQPTRLLGYFMFTWFILSLLLLILFNR